MPHRIRLLLVFFAGTIALDPLFAFYMELTMAISSRLIKTLLTVIVSM